MLKNQGDDKQTISRDYPKVVPLKEMPCNGLAIKNPHGNCN